MKSSIYYHTHGQNYRLQLSGAHVFMCFLLSPDDHVFQNHSSSYDFGRLKIVAQGRMSHLLISGPIISEAEGFHPCQADSGKT